MTETWMTELDSTQNTNCGASYKDKVVYLNFSSGKSWMGKFKRSLILY